MVAGDKLHALDYTAHIMRKGMISYARAQCADRGFMRDPTQRYDALQPTKTANRAAQVTLSTFRHFRPGWAIFWRHAPHGVSDCTFYKLHGVRRISGEVTLS